MIKVNTPSTSSRSGWFNLDDQPSQEEIPHLSIAIDSPSTIRSPPPPTSRSLHRAIRQPIGNSIKFPVIRSFSSASSRSFSSSDSTSPSTPHTAPIPTLRHSSVSLFELLNSHDGDNQRAHHQTLPSPYLLKPSISEQLSSQPLSPKSPNSIKFPSSTFSLVSPADPQDSLDRLIVHWLTNTFEADPTDSEADREAVPELDLLVGFKSITDQLNLPPLDRAQAWSALCHVFPTADSWARPTPAGLRSNKEFVVKGIQLKQQGRVQNQGHAKDLTRPVRTSTSETSQSAQIGQPFHQLDFNKPIPDAAHSKELIEYMRKRICALELRSQLPGAQGSSNQRKWLKYPNPRQFADQIKKQYNPPHRLFRFDHGLQSTHISTPGKEDLVHILGERIWCSLIKVCQHTKDNFLNGERLTASWAEHMNKLEFDLIVKNTKSHQTRAIETSSQKIVTIFHPFQKSNYVKLFKSQPVADFNTIVYNDDRRSNLIHHGPPDRKASDDPILKDLKIIQILPSALMRERFESDQQKSFFTTLSKRNLPKFINSNSHRGYETTIDHSKRKARGESMDLFSNPTALLINHPYGEAEKGSKERNSIGDLFESLNQNFRQQRKSLNLDKLFNHHQNRPPVKRDLVETLEVSYPDRPTHSILIVEEIVIEFNLLSLNKLKFQIKLSKDQV